MGKLQSPLPQKYHYRYEQILQLLAISGEIPTDLYEYLSITNVNYRKILSKLHKKNIIRSVKSDGATGYIFTPQGKDYALENEFLKKFAAEIITSTKDIQGRKRMHYYAVLYALFDKYGISYEKDNKRDISKVDIKEDTLSFYSASEYKALHGERGATFKGSRVLGYLSGNSKIYPIYVANIHLPEFSKVEFNLINQLRIDYYKGGGVENALLFCRSLYGVENILNDFLDFENSGKGQSIVSSGYYDDFIILPMTEHFQLQLWTLYNEETIRKQVIKQFNISQEKVSYSNEGHINNNEPVIFMLNVAAAKLKTFLSINAHQNKKGYIVCYDYMISTLEKQLTDKHKVGFISVRSNKLEENLKKTEDKEI